MNRLSVFALLFAVAPALSHAGEASRKIKVVLYDDKGSAGEGVPRITAQLAVVPDVELVKLNAEQIRTVDWSDAKVIIFSGGSGSAQSKNLQDAGLEKVRTFVEKGGGYIGICAGAYLACGGFSWGVKVLDAKTVSPKYNRGKAQVEVEFTAKGQEITGLKAESKVNMLYANGPIYCPAKMDAIPDFEPLAFYRTGELTRDGRGTVWQGPGAVQFTSSGTDEGYGTVDRESRAVGRGGQCRSGSGSEVEPKADCRVLRIQQP
jgi:putative intracellular protease/amidase